MCIYHDFQVKFSNLEGKTVLDLSKFQCDIILPLVEMMYTGELAVIPNLVEEVAKAAKYIGFQEAYKGCEVYMKFHKKGKLAPTYSITHNQI